MFHLAFSHLRKVSDENSLYWRGILLLNYMIGHGFVVDPICGDGNALKILIDHLNDVLTERSFFYLVLALVLLSFINRLFQFCF